MQVKLIPIPETESSLDPQQRDPESINVLKTFRTMYASAGYHPPWIGYFALLDGEVAGTCAFKGKPAKNKVEIAYYTYKSFESRGLAKHMCRMLVDIALGFDENIIITAQTLMKKSPSTQVLERNNFIRTGTATDHEAGEVWEWTYQKSKPKQPSD